MNIFKTNYLNSVCSFLKKTVISEISGAKAIIITDNNIYDDTAYIQMIDDESDMSANIPAGFLVGKSGLVVSLKIKKMLHMICILNTKLLLQFIYLCHILFNSN